VQDQFVRDHSNVVVVQSLARKFLSRKNLARRQHAVEKIQNAFRRYIAIRDVTSIRNQFQVRARSAEQAVFCQVIFIVYFIRNACLFADHTNVTVTS